MQITRYQPGAPDIPPALRLRSDPDCAAPDGNAPAVALIGDPALLDRKPVALFCSVQCPGDLIIQSYDLALTLRAYPVTLIGGFQSPIEKEFLELLLRQPPGPPPSASPSVIICPARGLANMRIPRPWRDPLAAGHLLLLSFFPDSLRRATTTTAAQRNARVATLAHRLLILHAKQGGKTDALCQQAISARKPVFCLHSPRNAHLIARGALPLSPNQPAPLLAG